MPRRPSRRKTNTPRAPRRTVAGKTPAAAFAELRRTITDAQIAQLRRMAYRDFLQSTYWSVVRAYKLHRQQHTCALCPSQVGLQVHHRSYAYAKGGEHKHLEDLIGLCRDCHAKFHDKLD